MSTARELDEAYGRLNHPATPKRHDVMTAILSNAEAYALALIYHEAVAENVRAAAKHGPQTHVDGTGWAQDALNADRAKRLCDMALTDGRLTWRHILAEEVAEAFAETDADKLRAELIQVAAMAGAWIADIDRRST